MPPPDRRAAVLDAAIATFLRFGYRKTSMEDVAQAAGVSRQGLYLHFATKEDLFRAALARVLETSLAEATRHLRDTARPLEARLVAACEAWMGVHVGAVGPGSDLAEASGTLSEGLVADHEGKFLDELVRAVRGSGRLGACRAAGVTARDVATTLLAAARGHKHEATTRADFGARVATVVKTLGVALTPEDSRV